MPIYAFAGSLTRPMPQYAAARGMGISRMLFDDDTGTLEFVDLTTGIDDTAWLVADPACERLYCSCEIPGARQSAVAAYAVAADGLRLLGRQPTLGNEACHASMTADGRFLLVANYNGANPQGYPDAALTMLPIVARDGSLGPPVASVRHTGSGPNRERQTTAHAHCVVSSAGGDIVYVVDLGTDELVAYALGEDGSLTRDHAKGLTLPSGLGPRHLVAHPEGTSLFLISELTPTVLSLGIDPLTQSISLRDLFEVQLRGHKAVQPAGLVLAPDNRHLFASLRQSDELLVLRVGIDGRLTETARVKSGGATPRDLAFSPSGRHLVVANQDSDRLTVFRVDHTDGTLSDPIQQFEVGTPLSIKLASF